jgi:hypothetical protein
VIRDVPLKDTLCLQLLHLLLSLLPSHQEVSSFALPHTHDHDHELPTGPEIPEASVDRNP